MFTRTNLLSLTIRCMLLIRDVFLFLPNVSSIEWRWLSDCTLRRRCAQVTSALRGVSSFNCSAAVPCLIPAQIITACSVRYGGLGNRE